MSLSPLTRCCSSCWWCLSASSPSSQPQNHRTRRRWTGMGERPDEAKSEMHEISREITARVHLSLSIFGAMAFRGNKTASWRRKKTFFAGKRLRDLEKEMRRVKEGGRRRKTACDVVTPMPQVHNPARRLHFGCQDSRVWLSRMLAFKVDFLPKIIPY